MENTSQIILLIGLIIFVSHFFTALFEKTRIPDVLLLILLGILLQISFLIFNIPVNFETSGRVLSSLALALMLFEGGSHLTFSVIKKTLTKCISISVITFILTTAVTFCIIYFFQPGATDSSLLSWIVKDNEEFRNFLMRFTGKYFTDYTIQQSLFTGVVLGSISPAVIIPILKLLKVSENTKSMLVVESAISDILSIVIAIGLVAFMSSGPDILSTSKSVDKFFFKDMLNVLLKTFIYSSMIAVIGSLIWSWILKKIRKFPNTIFTSLAFILILYGFSELMHEYGYKVNGPICVLLFGLILSNSQNMPSSILKSFSRNHLVEFTSLEKTFFSEIIFIVKTFFFIYLGASIFIALTDSFYNIVFLFWGLVITIFVYIMRILVTKLIISKNTNYNEAKMISYMIPKGLAAAVLAEYPLMHNEGFTIEEIEIFNYIRIIIYSVVFFSIVFTAISIILNDNKKIDLSYRRIFKKQFNNQIEIEETK